MYTAVLSFGELSVTASWPTINTPSDGNKLLANSAVMYAVATLGGARLQADGSYGTPLMVGN